MKVKKNLLASSMAKASLTLGLAAVLQPSVLAEDKEAASPEEEVLVVGSRIRRQDEVSNSPVQTLDAEALRVTGSISLGEVLQELPAVGSSLNSNGSAGTSHGSSSMNLRNLGENRSLILVNGRRWVNGAGTRGFRDFVDLNTIPQAIVERVEILQDGATAVYGADAIAGVVNIHTYQNYEGAKLTASYGQSAEGDRESTNINFLWGKNFGDSNWLLALSHADQEPIYTQDRELTAVPLNGITFGTAEGVFRENDLAGVTGATSITRDSGTDGSVVGNWRTSVSSTDRFNRYHNNYVTGPLERTAIYLQNRTPLADNLEFSFEALYNKRESGQLFSAVPPTLRGSRGFAIANDPRVNPFEVEFSGSDFRVDNFFVDNGQRDNLQEVETLRFGAGLNGEFDNGWSWDTFVSWAENEATFTSVNQIHLDKLALGMLACDTSGIATDVSDLAANCVPVNLFNPLTPEMVGYINFTGRDSNSAEQLDFTFNVTGELLSLPAGELAFAAGIEYRDEQGVDIPDAIINSAPRVNSYRTTTSAPRDGTVGGYELKEIYVEFSVPLLADQPLAESLTLDLATRYSDYSTFGSTTNSKVGMGYRPVQGLLVRGTWAEGFRAPSILELFEGARSTLVPVTDPCNGGGAGMPGCNGVPSTYVQLASTVPASVGGNRSLQPETSENLSFGMVITPSFLPEASLTMDWYKIELDDTISEYGAQDLLDLCATSGQRCNFITRDGSGEILDIADGPINLNSTAVEGLDIVARYGMDTDIGSLEFTLSLSKLIELTEESTLPNGNVLVEDKVGTSARRESFPEWRSQFSTRLRGENWSASYSARYIGDTQETASGTPRRIGSVTYHNISGNYSVDDNLTLKLGIDNVGDKQPPASLTNTNINFDQNTYTAVGRYIYLQATYDFNL